MEHYTYHILYQVEETHWWFVGRRSLILDQIARYYQGQKNLVMLDIGCGCGIFMTHLTPYGKIVGMDSSADALCFCQQRRLSHLVQGDAEMLPFFPNSFDLLTANDLLEHLDDDITSLHGFFSLLKPGGRLFVFVPAYQFLWSLQDEISHHKRRYTKRRLTHVIESAGFTIEQVTYANTLLFPVIWVGRQMLKIVRRFRDVQTENTLHPQWSNRVLKRIFCLERPLLRRLSLPFGVSLLAVCRKPL
ncbi:methyltransferase type 11 [Candidatus Vecturithrix granuli]|uniref:Methyltransferase type 11 n=1 Tax=Vecturithrix granuli TaxID=1499967 RepID=A0A0S6WAZ5_VECG1|nr:methyltransferase type 11 [Candidatus Vecturithrix granuli]